jgi:hypothetical protein
MKNKLLAVLSAALLAGPLMAHAGFVASYGSGVPASNIGGTFTSDTPVYEVGHPAYFLQDTPVSSRWVWGDDPTGFATINFTFNFDLTGYDLDTASLTGVWGADNIGTVTLNGHVVASLPTVLIENFYYQSQFTANIASLFNQGANTLVYSISNAGGLGAFRAGGDVYAEFAPEPPPAPDQQVAIPEPASLALAGLGLAGLGLSRRRNV